MNRKNCSAYTRNQLKLNLLALLVAVVVIPSSYARARSTDGLISSLGHAPPHFPRQCRILISGLIEKGESAVDPLIEALDGEFHESKYVYANRVSQISYCLSQIGGGQVETVLQKVITEQVKFDEDLNWRWEAVVCCSYAECAGERAVPLLVNLHNEATGENGNLQRVVALCALARTQNLEAISVVLDDSDFLSKQLDGEFYYPRWIKSMICLTLQSLVEGRTKTDLVSSPIYEKMWLGIAIHNQSRTTIIWNEKWSNLFDTEAVRGRWSRILQ